VIHTKFPIYPNCNKVEDVSHDAESGFSCDPVFIMKLPQRHGEVLLVFLIINVCFGHVWSHPWLSAGALRWPPLAESGEGGQEWEAPVRAQQCWRQTCDPYGSLEWCVQWGTSRGVWMVMIPGRVCGCINRPLITRSFSGLMRLGCSLWCSLVLFWLIQGVEWSP